MSDMPQATSLCLHLLLFSTLQTRILDVLLCVHDRQERRAMLPDAFTPASGSAGGAAHCLWLPLSYTWPRGQQGSEPANCISCSLAATPLAGPLHSPCHRLPC